MVFLFDFFGRNYTAWAFQMEMFLKGKVLWSHVDESEKEDIDAEGSTGARAA